MYFIKEEFISTYEERKSKFIAFLCPYDDFDNLMNRLKKEHPKARHFVYAYRYLNEFNQVVENCSDDGEPKGTSGKPTLNVLAGNEMINCAVITVRYFGGIKLGTGGLVRAYSDAINKVINSAKLYEYKKLLNVLIKVDYSMLSKIEYLLDSLEIKIKSKEFENSIILVLELTKEQLEPLQEQLPYGIDLFYNK